MLNIKQLHAGILSSTNMVVNSGQCIAICGPSGSGKTTLLNAIAGNINYNGQISVNGKRIDKLPSWQRPCRYLNQRLYLFPHLTVLGNMRIAQYAAKEAYSALSCYQLLSRLSIQHLSHRYPWQISGGEQQRAALARALVSRPKLLLLDEPFSSLDWNLRIQLWSLVKELREQFNMTILLVTHDPKEAEVLATQTYYIHQGFLSTNEFITS